MEEVDGLGAWVVLVEKRLRRRLDVVEFVMLGKRLALDCMLRSGGTPPARLVLVVQSRYCCDIVPLLSTLTAG